MKKYLFIDNYRGFSNTTVPLVDVNFLVGENSTGKTSLLGLLRILSSPSFYMGPVFGAGEDVQFGHFNEMVSVHSADREYFRIGFVEERVYPGPKGQTVVTGMLLTYKDHSGMPSLKRITYAQGNREMSLRLDDNVVGYKSTVLAKDPSVDDMVLSLQRWKEDHAADEADWKQVDMQGAPTSQVPVFMLLHFAGQSAGAKNFPGFPAFLGDFGHQVVWIAPIRTKPRRTYDEPNTAFSSEGAHTPYVIRRMLKAGPEAERFTRFIEKVGSASGLFQSIEIKPFGQESDDAPFEVDAVLDGKPLNLRWVGYGVSQSLPIFVELLDRPHGSWFAIQQPEVHLHPRAQASLGDVFFEMAITDEKRFVIETHSDFTIDRFRMNYRHKMTKKQRERVPDSQVLFFERKNGRNVVTPLQMGQRGELPADQPRGYRDFFVKEEMQLLDV